MVEAVGREFLEEYWEIIERCMKPKNSVGVLQSSTMPEPRKCICNISLGEFAYFIIQGTNSTVARLISFVNG